MNNQTAILTDLGFNRLEAEVYIQLLTHPLATAYKIGKLINKPTANVYKAMDTLAEKGAVIIEDNKTKLCTAVKPDEFLNLLEKTLLRKTEIAKQSLNNLNREITDQRSYSLKSVPLVFEKAKIMLKKCQKIAVIDAFPKALAKITGLLEETAKRGVSVHVEAYEHIDIPGVDVSVATIGKESTDHWKSQQLNIIIDGEEHLIALLDDELKKIKQATWSRNVYMSCILHAGRLREQTVVKILNKLNSSDFESDVKNILSKEKFFFNSDIPGFNKLFKS